MIRVRHAVPEDLPQLMEIAQLADTAAVWSEEQYQKILAPQTQAERITLAIYDDADPARLLGFLAGRECAGDWEIENVAVLRTKRRRGLGSRLLCEFLNFARRRGCNSIFLEVRESNTAARALYEKWRFAESGRRKGYYQNPQEDALLLQFSFPHQR
ncbi:MAG TPA: ribosomal protein S18-alanine N-acetyltransferase [Candidatus Angelobacter sp.]|nr:ribosomal protein S18-alanine N-acetyltransferase [Candidatus Angelobacter sp.]